MKIIDPSVELLWVTPNALQEIERAGRVCYKSEDKITEDSAKQFIKGIIKRGHEAVIEHASASIKFICDRGVSHELVRHRLVSFCQESTRYCCYSKEKFGGELTFIKPCFWPAGLDPNLVDTKEEPKYWQYLEWQGAMLEAERRYLKLIFLGASPQEARAVLPNSLKTEIIMTANFREWKHIFKLRTSSAAHPQMIEVMSMAKKVLVDLYPDVFGEI